MFLKNSIYLFFGLFFFFALLGCNSKNNVVPKDSVNALPQNKEGRIISDYSNLLDALEKENLTKKIQAYERSTSNEIAIVIVDSIPKSYTILAYATDIANEWGVGKKELNNGLLIAMASKQKVIAIATGYGTEKTLTDSICKQLIDKVMIPKFKKDMFFEGFDNGIDSLMVKW